MSLFAALGIGFYGCNGATDAMGDDHQRIPDGEGEDAITISDEGNRITLDLSANSLSGLRSDGGWMLIRDANTLVVNVGADTIRSFTSVCTHAGCATNWSFNDNLFECGCHNSRFNTSGGVVRGPATRDLDEFTVSRDNDIVTIQK